MSNKQYLQSLEPTPQQPQEEQAKHSEEQPQGDEQADGEPDRQVEIQLVDEGSGKLGLVSNEGLEAVPQRGEVLHPAHPCWKVCQVFVVS